MTSQILLVRPLPGEGGETRRATHLVEVPKGAAPRGSLRTCCGRQFEPGELELLDGVGGMPCEACLLKVPNGDGRATADAGALSARLAELETTVEVLFRCVDRVVQVIEQRSRQSSGGFGETDGSLAERAMLNRRASEEPGQSGTDHGPA
ncbi:hypothetical protein GCM10017566_16790 [Amycolatopsis bartoniae]|uniref:Uncharacterized protein n=1 Tax=Amycolatopsis bartoniae TaxID=941986 RepID=A0A8H9IPM3_9PSEU|nr:hypothetical protein GCM10017566_16790 [Amycolatopsis bartoniae]